MANTDQNITELPIKTASEVLDEDYMLGIDLVEGYQVSTKDFADYAVNRAAISIGGKTQTTASAISEVRTTAGNAQPKESGKGLSANDFTNAYKSKLDGIAAGAEVNVQSDWNASSGDAAILHKPTTISGYGITDAYTKTQVDTSLAAKSDKATTYTKSDVDAIVNTDDDTSEAANHIVIETDAAQYAKKTHLTLAPVQDLHGYDHPWPAGGGKNLLDDSAKEVGTFSGVTVSQNSKGQFILNGTATANNNVKVGVVTLPSGSYIFSGMKSTGSSSTFFLNLEPQWNGTSNQNLYSGEYSGTSDAERTYTARIYFRSGQSFSNTIFEPMLRKSTDSADFEPYSNICPITPMGHRNLLPMTVSGVKSANTQATWSGNSITVAGVTFTLETQDGESVTAIKANGTANGSITFKLSGNILSDLGGKSCSLNGCPSGGSYSSGYAIYIYNNSTQYTFIRDEGSGVTGTFESGVDYVCAILVRNGTAINNLTFKPMIRLVSDPDSTFVPYGMARVGAKVTGFNQWDEEWEQGDLYDATGLPHTNADRIRSKNYIPVVPGATYYFKTPSAYTDTIELVCFDKNKQWVAVGTVSLGTRLYDVPNNVYYIKFYTKSTYGGTYNHDICINISDAEKNGTYAPYTEYTAALDLPEPVYGGTLDLETGEVVADMGMVDLGTLNWAYVAQYQFFYANISGRKQGSDIILCSDYTYGGYKSDAQMGTATDKSLYRGGNASTVINAKDTSYVDAAAFKTAMSGVQLAYELATPKTYQLTPQQLALFKGINNISTNAKTVQVTYRNGELATTGDIVDAVEVAKQNAIGESASYTDARLATELAPILGNFASAETSPASASHAVGEYLLYNNRLYKVLAAISAGQQLTIGTNIEQTSVAAELARLNSLLT